MQPGQVIDTHRLRCKMQTDLVQLLLIMAEPQGLNMSCLGSTMDSTRPS